MVVFIGSMLSSYQKPHFILTESSSFLQITEKPTDSILREIRLDSVHFIIKANISLLVG